VKLIMKKVLLMAAFAVASLAANAQSYVGGTIGFQNNKNNSATTENTVTGFTINPEFGTALNEKWGIGIELGFGYNKNKTEYVGTAAGTASDESSTTRFQIKPYARYQALKWGMANIFVDGGLNFGLNKAKDMKAAMDLGLFVSPGVAFNVSESWSIVARLTDFFTFNFAKSAVPDVAGAPDAPTSISAGLGTGKFTTGNIEFGIYYNF